MKLRTKNDPKPKKKDLGLDLIASEIKNEVKKATPKPTKPKREPKKSTKKKQTVDIEEIKKEVLAQLLAEHNIILLPNYMEKQIKKVLDYAHHKAKGNRSGGWMGQIEIVMEFFKLVLPHYP